MNKMKWKQLDKTSSLDLQYDDCSIASRGECYRVNNKDECLDITKELEGETQFTIYNNNWCIPVRPVDNINPMYRLKYSNSSQDSAIFYNSDELEYPPDEANIIFNFDLIDILSETDSNNNYELPSNGSDFNSMNNIQLVKQTLSRIHGIYDSYITFGESLEFHVPGTTLLVKTVKTNTDNYRLVWKSDPVSVSEFENIYFQIMPSEDFSEYKIHDCVPYNTPVMIAYNGRNGWLVWNKQLKEYNIVHGDKITIKTNPHYSSVFVINSKENGYVCKNNKCTEIPLRNTTQFGKYGRRKDNKTVYRHNDMCFDQCALNNSKLTKGGVPQTQDNQSNSYIWIFILLAILFFVICIVVIVIFSRN